MWLQSYVLPLGFLLFTICRAVPEQPIKYTPSRMDVDCSGRFYTEKDLDTAANEACSRSSNQVFCRDYISAYYVKKCIPAIPKVSIYKGPFYKDQSLYSPLLRWPLPKRTVFEKARYHAIIYWDPEKRVCKTIGAIQEVRGQEPIKCHLKKYSEAKNEDTIRSSSLQTENNLRHPHMNTMEKSPEELQYEFPLPTRDSADIPQSNTAERLKLKDKLRQSLKKLRE